MNWDHDKMTVKQKELFTELALSGRPNTLSEHTRIAIEALKAGGVPEDLARQMVAAALNDLRNAGVRSPSRISWH